MLKVRTLLLRQRRFKGDKARWMPQHKRNNTDRALENFDDFYGAVYGIRWRNMRAALLSEHKYVALVNNFGDTEKTCGTLELAGAINVKSLVKLAQERFAAESAPIIEGNSGVVGNRMDAFAKLQEQREKEALYPAAVSESTQIPEHLQFKDSDVEAKQEETDEKDKHKVAKFDAHKSLEQALEEDSHIDRTRLVDPQYGSGGLYDFVPANKIKGMEDWVPESHHYKYYPTSSDFPLNIQLETEFVYPENLCLYTYEMGNTSDFKTPTRCITGVLSHFLMDGASALPPLFLNVKHGERVLDACAAPGGKSLLMLQTLLPYEIVCNDIQESRVNRIRKVMQEYVFDYKQRWEGKRILLSQCDARNLDLYNTFDKILVDVPCTTDRHSLKETDNNIFKPARVKERLRLPELQAAILTNCIRLLRPGGSLVYSTCSLSPVQNDGVVHMALQRAFSDYGITSTIKDLSLLTRFFADIYKFENPSGLKYGQMVVPFLPANFGPMYFSKITRDG